MNGKQILRQVAPVQPPRLLGVRGKSGVDKQLALPPGWCGIGGGVKEYDRRPVPISVDGAHICVVCRVSEAGFATDTGRVLMQHLVIVPHLKPGVIAPAGGNRTAVWRQFFANSGMLQACR